MLLCPMTASHLKGQTPFVLLRQHCRETQGSTWLLSLSQRSVRLATVWVLPRGRGPRAQTPCSEAPLEPVCSHLLPGAQGSRGERHLSRRPGRAAPELCVNQGPLARTPQIPVTRQLSERFRQMFKANKGYSVSRFPHTGL